LLNIAEEVVVQRGRSLGFPLEAAEGLCVVGEFVGKELQGDVATEFEIFRLIHHTHAAAANSAEDAVMGNRLARGLVGRGHWLDMLGGDAGKVNKEMELALSPKEKGKTRFSSQTAEIWGIENV
jgi:hypothetical protein